MNSVVFRARFALAADFDSIEAIYSQWFPAETSVADEVYKKLLDREQHTRVLERTASNGPDEIVGFYTLWGLSKAKYQDLVAGRSHERELTADDVLRLNDPRARVLYVPEIGALPRSKSGTALLRDGFRYVCLQLHEHVHFELVAALAYSQIGAKMAGKLGFRVLRPSLFVELDGAAARERCP